MTSLRALLDEAAKRAAAGSIDDALAAYAEALACAPTLPEAHYNVAGLQMAKGDLAGAEASLRDAARLKPGWAQPYLGLGHLYLRQKRFEDAERAFEHAAELARLRPKMRRSGSRCAATCCSSSSRRRHSTTFGRSRPTLGFRYASCPP